MKTLRNPQKYGALGQIVDTGREKPLGVACHECDEEIFYSLTSFHHGHPEIRCRTCGKRGYMVRAAREGGRLIWFREAPPAESEFPGMNVKHIRR
jgi:ribosomal protein S27E